MPKILETPKEMIIEKAKEIVYKEGYKNLTIRRVAKLCDIGVGTVYNYFPTKRELDIQLMEDYWTDYLIEIDKIDKSEKDLYTKLRKIYDSLETFIITFIDIWVRESSERQKEYAEEGIVRRKDFTEKLIQKIDGILLKSAKDNHDINIPENSQETARFIVLNLIMMAHMKQFSYDSFEKIIKKLFK